jgi:hypothetical protein
MILAILALALAPHTGVLKGHISIGPLTATERRKYKTMYSKEQSIAGYELQIFPAKDSKEEGEPVEDVALTEDGNFKFDLPTGAYFVTITHSMHAGAYSVYPNKRVVVRTAKTTRVSLHVRSEVYK